MMTPRVENSLSISRKDLTIFKIELQNFKTKSQIESHHFKSNLNMSNQIAKMVQIAI